MWRSLALDRGSHRWAAVLGLSTEWLVPALRVDVAQAPHQCHACLNLLSTLCVGVVASTTAVLRCFAQCNWNRNGYQQLVIQPLDAMSMFTTPHACGAGGGNPGAPGQSCLGRRGAHRPPKEVGDCQQGGPMFWRSQHVLVTILIATGPGPLQ
jgi:hypothetical protein